MWLFRHKFDADGKLARYKAQLVANGRSQELRNDRDETFSPAVKLATIRAVLDIVVACDSPLHQLDIKNTLLHMHLKETVYMHRPPGFVDKLKSDNVCLLH